MAIRQEYWPNEHNRDLLIYFAGNRDKIAGVHGDRLRAISTLDHEGRGTGRALLWLRNNYTKPFHLEELAAMARMGISTFNHHFRAVTSISPLQYQKQLRLFAARERMLVEGLDATRAALEVG